MIFINKPLTIWLKFSLTRPFLWITFFFGRKGQILLKATLSADNIFFKDVFLAITLLARGIFLSIIFYLLTYLWSNILSILSSLFNSRVIITVGKVLVFFLHFSTFYTYSVGANYLKDFLDPKINKG